MNNTLQQLRNIGLSVIALIMALLLAGVISKIDNTGGISMIMVFASAILFLFYLIRFIIRIFWPPVAKDAPIINYAAKEKADTLIRELNIKAITLFVFLIFLALLATSGGRTANYTNALTFSNAFNGWLWWPVLGCFITGLGVFNYTDYWRKDRYSGNYYILRKYHKGGGLSAALATVMAYITGYFVWIFMAHFGSKVKFPAGVSVTAIIVGSFMIIPLIILFYKLFHSIDWKKHLFIYGYFLLLVIIGRVL